MSSLNPRIVIGALALPENVSARGMASALNLAKHGVAFYEAMSAF